MFNFETILSGIMLGFVGVLFWAFIVGVNGKFRQHQAVNLIRGRGLLFATGEAVVAGNVLGLICIVISRRWFEAEMDIVWLSFWGGLWFGVGLVFYNFWRCIGLTTIELYLVAKLEQLDEEVYEREVKGRDQLEK